jgi:alpha-glucosidase (family GH31 glycosyl hydrolase)
MARYTHSHTYNQTHPLFGPYEQWTGDAYIFDPTAPRAQEYWTQMTKEFYDTVVPVDGMWIDMYVMCRECQRADPWTH